MELHAQTPQAFVDWLVGQGLTCFYLVSTATQGLVPSHTALQPLADYLTRDCQDFGRPPLLVFTTEQNSYTE